MEVVLQRRVVLGVAVQEGYGIQAPEFHPFYGFVAIIAAALIYSYWKQMQTHRYLLYGFGGLFLMGLGLRAMALT